MPPAQGGIQIPSLSYGRHAGQGVKHLGHPSDFKDTLSLVPVGVRMTMCLQPRAGHDWAHVKIPCKESGARARKSQSLLVKLDLLGSQRTVNRARGAYW